MKHKDKDLAAYRHTFHKQTEAQKQTYISAEWHQMDYKCF